MKKLLVMTAAVVASVCIASSAMALNFGTSSDIGKRDCITCSLQEVFNDFTVDSNTVNEDGEIISGIDVKNDYLADEKDSYWLQTATGISAMTMIIEIAGNEDGNTFGIYDKNDQSVFVELFSGLDSPGIPEEDGGSLAFSILADGSVYINFQDTGIDFSSNTFGFYLDSTAGPWGPGGVFYSDSSLNSDNTDHMAAYQGNNIDKVRLTDDHPEEGLTWSDNEFILAWEDLANTPGSGIDFDYNDFVVMVESVEPVPEPGTMFLLGAGLLGLLALKRKRS